MVLKEKQDERDEADFRYSLAMLAQVVVWAERATRVKTNA